MLLSVEVESPEDEGVSSADVSGGNEDHETVVVGIRDGGGVGISLGMVFDGSTEADDGAETVGALVDGISDSVFN